MVIIIATVNQRSDSEQKVKVGVRKSSAERNGVVHSKVARAEAVRSKQGSISTNVVDAWNDNRRSN